MVLLWYLITVVPQVLYYHGTYLIVPDALGVEYFHIATFFSFSWFLFFYLFYFMFLLMVMNYMTRQVINLSVALRRSVANDACAHARAQPSPRASRVSLCRPGYRPQCTTLDIVNFHFTFYSFTV